MTSADLCRPGVMPGDGTGPEVFSAAVRAVDAALDVAGAVPGV